MSVVPVKPLISVIIPVYNAGEHLPECIESVLSQTLAYIEVIAVDDGSDDDSGRLLDEYAEKDWRLKVIHKCNEGVSEARNEALKHVQGEYIGFVDSDDWIDPDMYEIMLKYAVEKKADIVMCGYIREFGDHSKLKVFDTETGKTFDREELRRSFIRKMIGPVAGEAFITENLDMHSTVWNKLYHTHLVKDIEFCSLKEIGSCEDLLFNLSAFNKANSAVFIGKACYHYRKASSASVTSRYRPRLMQQRSNLIGKVCSYINDCSLPPIYHEALNNRVCLGVMGLGFNIIFPVSDLNFPAKVKEIRKMLSDEQISTAFRNFSTAGLPFHWKVFYYFAKERNSVCFYFILKIVRVLIFIIR